jgi:hypothetical protein
MNDFLSNLVERSFTDSPLIRPRVPSLFEPTPNDFFDTRESSSSVPLTELSPVQKTGRTKSVAPVSDLTEEHLPKPRRSRRQAMSAEALPQAKQVIVPVASSRAEGDHPSSATEVFGKFSETHFSQPRRRKDFAPVEKPSSQSARIIRVTIGRVEVRAVHSPAPASKQAKPRLPKLSLEDYLRKRQRGSR